MHNILPCPICGCAHRPLVPDNRFATQIIGKGPKLTWVDFAEGGREVTVFQVCCINCGLQGPHAQEREEACGEWNDNAQLIADRIESLNAPVAIAA